MTQNKTDMALNKKGIDLKAIRRDQKAIDALPNHGRASVNHASHDKALTKKAGKSIEGKKNSIKSYQPDQMYSDAAMKRFSAKRKRLGHAD